MYTGPANLLLRTAIFCLTSLSDASYSRKTGGSLKLPLEKYVPIGIGIASLTIVLIALAQYNTMQVIGRSGRWVDHSTRTIREITAMASMAKTAESAARAFVLTGDPVSLSTMKESIASANQHEPEVRSLTADNPRQQRRLDNLEPLMAECFKALDELALKRGPSREDAAAQIVRNAGIPLAAAVESLTWELQNEEYSLLEAKTSSLDGGTARARTGRAIAAAFSLLLLAAASVLIRFDGRRRFKLETELQYEKDLFTTLMDTLPDRVYFKDPESRFLRINTAKGRRLGLANVAEAIGRSDADFYTAEQAEKARSDEKEVFRTGCALIDKEEVRTTISGREEWVMSSKLPMVNRDGTIIGTFGISRDITVSKQAEQELESANSKLTRWNDQLELRNRESMLLADMGELLQTCVNEEEAERVLSRFAADFWPALSGALGMINASRSSVEIGARWGESGVLAAVSLPEDCWALRRGRPHGSSISYGQVQCAHIVQGFTGAFVCVPVMAHGEVLGVLHLLRLDGHELDESELRLAAMNAERMGLAIANLRLREALKSQSIRDPVTGLFNRRFMEETFERERYRADRNRNTIGAIMLDLDHFKEFNDTFGHDGGDAILKEFSQLLLARTRKEDIVCRYGGEEFLIVLPGASLDDTHDRAESLLTATRKITVVSRGRELGHVSASMGVALYPSHGDTVRSLIRAADDALFQAKAHGRDRVMLAGTHPISSSELLNGGALNPV
jgi:diguanylate cyclase (GGDEF)-like protein/PAS domain S-box-containing protein